MRAPLWLRALASIAGLVACLVFLYPLIWMTLGSFKSNRELFDSERFWPSSWSLEYIEAMLSSGAIDFWGGLSNSIFISGTQAAAGTVIALLGGYALGSGAFMGRRWLLALGALTVLVPMQTMALPLFSWIIDLGLANTRWGVILPGLVNGLGLLFFARAFGQVPRELRELARAEGASEARVCWTLLPLLKAHALAYAFVHFALAWHAHFFPMLVLHGEELRTLPLSLTAFYGGSFRAPQGILMAGATLGMAPLVLLFGLAYRHMRSALSEVV